MTGIRVQTVRPDDFARVTSVVVVPARNEENFIAACLSGLFAQSGTAPAGIVIPPSPVQAASRQIAATKVSGRTTQPRPWSHPIASACLTSCPRVRT